VKRRVLFEVDLKSDAIIVLKALFPEVKTPVTRRTRAHIQVRGTVLLLDLVALDTSALRACVNAYGRWLSGIIKVLDRLKLLYKTISNVRL
jgi:tRNA threonylcarbamoyladenosine modification (KEOPS) complex  Pcc1 subunit